MEDPNSSKPTRDEILSTLGRRARQFIADAQEGDSLIGSMLTFKPTTGELLRWKNAGLIRGGFSERGERNGDMIVCAI